MSNVVDIATLRVGPSKKSQGGQVQFKRYESGELAIQVFGEDGPEYTATVCLPGVRPPGRYGVWLKGWFENEGVPQALERAGIVELTGYTASNGRVTAEHATLTPKAQRIVDRMAD